MMSIGNFLFYILGVADMPIDFEESFTLGILVSTISDLCNERGITIKALEKDLKFGNGTIRRWDTSKPAISAVVKVACYFDVSVDYLLGMSSYRKHETQNITVKDIGLSETAVSVLQQYRQLGVNKVVEAINALLENDPFDNKNVLRCISAYLFFEKDIERDYKITDEGHIIEKNTSIDENSNNSMTDFENDILMSFFVPYLYTIADNVLFEEALFNLASVGLRELKNRLRKQREGTDNGITENEGN